VHFRLETTLGRREAPSYSQRKHIDLYAHFTAYASDDATVRRIDSNHDHAVSFESVDSILQKGRWFCIQAKSLRHIIQFELLPSGHSNVKNNVPFPEVIGS